MLEDVVSLDLPLIIAAFCRNPVAPFFEWEQPVFWQNLDYEVCEKLLNEAALPPVVVSAMAQSPDDLVRDIARLHLSQTAPLRTPKNGNQALTKYWQNYCRMRAEFAETFASVSAYLPSFYDWYAELVELELSPPCLTPLLPVAPPRPVSHTQTDYRLS